MKGDSLEDQTHKLMHALKAIVIMSLAVLTSCAKDGEDGAQGPQGNANVQSATYSVSPGDWGAFGTAGQVGYGFGVNLNAPIVSSSIASSGAVLVYLKSGTDRWVAMPLTFPEGATWNKTWLYSIGPSSVQLEVYDDDLYTAAPTVVHEFRIVAIANSGMMVNSGVDLTDYDAVSDFLGLDD